MNKKYRVLIGIIVLVVVLGGIGLAIKQSNKSSSTGASEQNNSNKQLTLKFSDLQAHYPQNPATCLTTSDDPNLKLSSTDQTDIVNAAIGTVIDIPAGTNADVHIKSYDKTTATGTSIYESTYGSYNFTAKKTNANQGSWVVTKFVACKK